MKEKTCIIIKNASVFNTEYPCIIHCSVGEELCLSVQQPVYNQEDVDNAKASNSNMVVVEASGSMKYFVHGIIEEISNSIIPISTEKVHDCHHIRRIYVTLDSQSLATIENNAILAKQAGKVLAKNIAFE